MGRAGINSWFEAGIGLESLGLERSQRLAGLAFSMAQLATNYDALRFGGSQWGRGFRACAPCLVDGTEPSQVAVQEMGGDVPEAANPMLQAGVVGIDVLDVMDIAHNADAGRSMGASAPRRRPWPLPRLVCFSWAPAKVAPAHQRFRLQNVSMGP